MGDVFTRKLYTMQGQRAFDEIRRKYRSDREFMQTVDRYVAEFERLLDEVSRDDRGQVMAMLAPPSGETPTSQRPPVAVTMASAMARPRPAPPGLSVAR